MDFDFNRIISLCAYYKNNNINRNDSVIEKIKYIVNNNIIYFNQNPEVEQKIKVLEKEIRKLKKERNECIKMHKNFEEDKYLEYLEMEYEKLKSNKYDNEQVVNDMLELHEKDIKHHIQQSRNMLKMIELDINPEMKKILADFYYNDKPKKNKDLFDKEKWYETKDLSNNTKLPKIQVEFIDKTTEEIKKKKQELILLKKDILSYIVPLSRVLTYKRKNINL